MTKYYENDLLSDSESSDSPSNLVFLSGLMFFSLEAGMKLNLMSEALISFRKMPIFFVRLLWIEILVL